MTGWFNGLSLLAGSLMLIHWQIQEKSPQNTNPVQWAERFSAALAATYVIVVMGFLFDTYVWDWHKHWALIRLLKDESWPVQTTLNGEQFYLRFYMAAYIVPAVVSAKLQIPLVLATATWYWLGCYLFFRILAIQSNGDRYIRKRQQIIIAIFIPFLFIFSGGVDWLITRLLHGPLPFGVHSEWWADQFLGFNWQYSSPLGALTWVPHQAIATFIAVALLIHKKSLPSFLIAYTALSLYSPLAMIGMLPLLLIQFLQYRLELNLPHRRVIITTGLLMVTPVLAAAYFLSSDLPATGLGGVNPNNIPHHLSSALLFVLFELALVWSCLGRKVWRDPLLRTSLIILVALPLLSAGNPPDFVMRASIGPLVLLLFAAIKEFPKRLLEDSWPRKITVLTSFVIILPTTLNESAFHLQAGEAYRYLSRGDPIAPHAIYYDFATMASITINEFFDTCGWNYLPQYFAKAPAFVTTD